MRAPFRCQLSQVAPVAAQLPTRVPLLYCCDDPTNDDVCSIHFLFTCCRPAKPEKKGLFRRTKSGKDLNETAVRMRRNPTQNTAAFVTAVDLDLAWNVPVLCLHIMSTYAFSKPLVLSRQFVWCTSSCMSNWQLSKLYDATSSCHEHHLSC